MKKIKNKFVSIIMCIFLGIIILLLFNLMLQREGEDIKYKDYFSQEIYFLMFTPASTPKEINVYFPEDISWITSEQLEEAKLYQDKRCIKESYSLKKGNEKNQIIILLNEFTPEFNKIVLNTKQNSKISLSVAQYYIDNYSHLDTLNDSTTWFAGNGHKKSLIDGVIMERSFTKGLSEKGFDGELSVYINHKALDLDYINESSLEILSNNPKEITAKYTLKLNNDKFIEEKIYRIVIETVWVAEKDDVRISVLENKIPIKLQ